MEKPYSPGFDRPGPFRRPGRPRRLRNVALLPTLVTLGNGVCGMLALLQIAYGLAGGDDRHFDFAAWLILGGMVFDALDGWIARMTRTASRFGAQLDSLCDLITFGAAPALLVFAVSRGKHDEIWQSVWNRPLQAVCVLYAMCALIRLARFTVETGHEESQHREFAGLPTPAAAGVLAAAVLPMHALMRYDLLSGLNGFLIGALPILAFVLGVLMVSRLRYLHVVNRVLAGNRPFVTLVELALGISLAFIFQEFAIFLGFFAYAVTGPVVWVRRRLSRKEFPGPADAPEAPPAGDDNLF